MQTIEVENRLHVVVGILEKDGRYLVQQRPAGKPCAGFWEFPGGKVESGETAFNALLRELQEELCVQVNDAELFLELTHDYDHAKVYLQVFRSKDFSGEPIANENQTIAWRTRQQINDMNVLEAVYPILEKLS